MANRKGTRSEFRVVLSGVQLTQEQSDKINGAVQAAALQAMVDLDFGGDRSVAIPLRDLELRGIWVGPILDDIREQLLQGGLG